MKQERDENLDFIVVKKVWFILAAVASLVAAVVSPVIAGYAAYSRSMSGMDDKISALQVDSAKTLVTKEDLKELKGQLESIRQNQFQTAEAIGNLRGLIERKK